MANFDWKSVIKTVAPALAAALGGPLAGVATQAIATAVLGKDSANADEDIIAEAVMNASPETLAKIKEAEYQFRKDMAALGVDFEKLEVQDRANAREFARTNMVPQMVLTFVFIISYFIITSGTIYFLFEDGEVNKEMLVLVSTLLGVFTGEVPRIMAFWFGSSTGSKTKDSALKA
jgi:putative sterol carrier protein